MLVLLSLFFSFNLPSCGEDDSLLQAVLYVCGADDVQDIPEDEYSRLCSFAAHPLPVNRSSRGALERSGLFSRYQLESLLDYISRTGPVLSAAELAVVDGFNSVSAAHLACFLSFSADSSPGEFHHSEEVTAGGGVAVKDGAPAWKYRARASAELDGRLGRLSSSLAFKNPSEFCGSLSYSAPRVLRNVTAGFFNARFGQGLGMWSGVSIDNWSSPSSLMKRPSATSAYGGWSGSYAMLGLAATLDVGRFSISPFADIRGGSYGANFGYSHRHGQLGTTFTASTSGLMQISADFQHSFQGIVFFGEALAGYDFRSPLPLSDTPWAVLAGVRANAGIADMGTRFTVNSSELRSSCAVSLSNASGRHKGDIAADASWHMRAHGHSPADAVQLRFSSKYSYRSKGLFGADSRLYSRFRFLGSRSDPSAPYAASWPLLRFDARQSVGWTSSHWKIALRADAVALAKSVSGRPEADFSFLAAVDSRLDFSVLSVFMQAAVFKVDSWDSRIYLYHNDVPGVFSVPAMYGRGYTLSGLIRLKFGRTTELYLKCSYCSYPWARSGDARKRDSLDASIQISYYPAKARWCRSR